MKKYPVLLSLICIIYMPCAAQVTCCDSIVPVFNVDLTGANAGTTWTSPSVVRNGYCCSATGSERCIQFIVTTDSNTCGFTFGINPSPPGSIYLQICCGVILSAQYRDTNYINPGVHPITFCKPGSGSVFAITSITSCDTASKSITDTCPTVCPRISVDINEESVYERISISPNPAASQITISRLPNRSKGGALASLVIADLFGRVVLQSQISNHTSQIDISSLAAGVYMVAVRDAMPDSRQGEKVYYGKLVKQ